MRSIILSIIRDFPGQEGGGGKRENALLANMQMDNNTEEKIGQPPKKRGNGQKRGRKEGRGRGRKKRMKKRKSKKGKDEEEEEEEYDEKDVG